MAGHRIIVRNQEGDYVPVSYQFAGTDGAAMDPTAASLIVYAADTGGTTWPTAGITGSPFTLAKIASKTGWYGARIAKTALPVGRYNFRVEATVDSVSAAMVERVDVLESGDFAADVSWLSTFDPEADSVDVGKVAGTAVAGVADFRATGFSTFDPASDEVTTDETSRIASKADVAALATSAELAALELHGDTEWATADVSALATSAEVAALETAISVGAAANVPHDPGYSATGWNLAHGTHHGATNADLEFAPAATGLDVDFQFDLGSKIPSILKIYGRYRASAPTTAGFADIYAWDVAASAWEMISSAADRMGHSTSYSEYSFVLFTRHVSAGGIVAVRFVSARTNTADRLDIEVLYVEAISAGATAGDIAGAVWAHNIRARALDGTHTSSGYFVARSAPEWGGVVSASGADVTMNPGSYFRAEDGLYAGRTIQFHRSGFSEYEIRRIEAQVGAVLTLDRVPVSAIDSGWHAYILPERSGSDVSGVATSAELAALELHGDTAWAPADVSGIETTTDRLAAMIEIAGAVGSEYDRWTATSLELAPDTGAASPSVEEIRIEMDTNSTRLAHLDANISSLPTAAQNADAVLIEQLADHYHIEGSVAEALSRLDVRVSMISSGDIHVSLSQDEIHNALDTWEPAGDPATPPIILAPEAAEDCRVHFWAGGFSGSDTVLGVEAWAEIIRKPAVREGRIWAGKQEPVFADGIAYWDVVRGVTLRIVCPDRGIDANIHVPDAETFDISQMF